MSRNRPPGDRGAQQLLLGVDLHVDDTGDREREQGRVVRERWQCVGIVRQGPRRGPDANEQLADALRHWRELELRLGRILVSLNGADVVWPIAFGKCLEDESVGALDQDVGAAVWQGLSSLHMGHTADVAGRDLALAHPFGSKEHTEDAVARHAVGEHRPIARLIDVEGAVRAREQHQRQWEQRQAPGHVGVRYDATGSRTVALRSSFPQPTTRPTNAALKDRTTTQYMSCR